MNVLFWGTPDFALPAYRALGEEGHQVVGVVTQPDRPAGRGREVRTSPIKRAARADGVPVLQPESARGEEFLEQIRALRPDVSVVVAYGQILKPEVLAVPRHGSLNIHASLLPELRGAAPVHWAIMRGHEVTGVSIMQMDAGLDSGPVLYQVQEPIRADEAMCELALRLSEIGAEAMIETLAMLEADAIEPVAQDHERATYAPKLTREDARLDWSLPADDVARRIRGLDDVPGAWSEYGEGVVKLFRPQVEEVDGEPGEVLEAGDDGLVVAAGDGSVRILDVQPSGKRRMSAAEWARGRGIARGARLR